MERIETVPRSNLVNLPARRNSRRPLHDTLGVMDQLRLAADDKPALFVGTLFGAWVPFATYFVAHEAVTATAANPVHQASMIGLVLGGLLYSAITVYGWGRRAFRSRPKAIGFALLTEGVLTLVPIPWLSVVALAYLMIVNGVATGATMSLDRRPVRQ